MPNPRRKPLQERSRETVAVILEAAAQILTRFPEQPFTTNHIAARAGVSVGSIYQYFDTKDEILKALVRSHADDMESLFRDLLSAQAHSPPETVLPLLIAQGVRAHHEEAETQRRLLAALRQLGMQPELDALDQRLAGHLEVYLYRWRACLNGRDPALAAWMISQLGQQLTHRWLELGSPFAVTDLIRELQEMIKGYLALSHDTLPKPSNEAL